jgi:hypothetical protein
MHVDRKGWAMANRQFEMRVRESGTIGDLCPFGSIEGQALQRDLKQGKEAMQEKRLPRDRGVIILGTFQINDRQRSPRDFSPAHAPCKLIVESTRKNLAKSSLNQGDQFDSIQKKTAHERRPLNRCTASSEGSGHLQWQ